MVITEDAIMITIRKEFAGIYESYLKNLVVDETIYSTALSAASPITMIGKLSLTFPHDFS